MNSYDVKITATLTGLMGQAKRPWITPSLQMIALKSAESGSHSVGKTAPVASSIDPILSRLHCCEMIFSFCRKLASNKFSFLDRLFRSPSRANFLP